MSDDQRHYLAGMFEGSAALYERARPTFPDAAVDWAIPAGARQVLDLGAGTGKLTRSLVARGLSVTAVDRSPDMLGQLEAALPPATALVGTAEAIPLADASMDAVVVGSAFHWFDRPAADAEIARVLRPGGTVALFWNRRDPDSPLADPFHAARGKSPAVSPNQNRDITLDRSWFGPTGRAHFPHQQTVDAQGLVDLVASRSYVIAMSTSERTSLLAEVLAFAQRTAGSGTVDVPYLTLALKAQVLRS